MKHLIGVLSLLLPLSVAMADNMQFHGTLVVPPCTVNDGQTIEVAFGTDLGVNKIDGANYKKPVKYTLSCPEASGTNSVAVVVDTTTPAAFDASAVKTDKTGLGIRILVDGAAATFAQNVTVDNPASPPVIEAVPVQDPGVTLTEGAFEATMTLRAEYI